MSRQVCVSKLGVVSSSRLVGLDTRRGMCYLSDSSVTDNLSRCKRWSVRGLYSRGTADEPMRDGVCFSRQAIWDPAALWTYDAFYCLHDVDRLRMEGEVERAMSCSERKMAVVSTRARIPLNCMARVLSYVTVTECRSSVHTRRSMCVRSPGVCVYCTARGGRRARTHARWPV